MNKTMKILSVVMIVMMMAMVVTPVVFATQPDPSSMTPIYGSETGTIQTIGQRVLGIITTIGIVISVVVIAGLGLKYIIGSSEEKAEYKKSFIPLLVGMILLLGASTIAKFIISAAQATSK